jgi:hypothetical protein
MGFGPLGPTSPPGSVEPDWLGSGSVNQPSPAPSLFLLSSSSSLANPKSPPPSPDQSGHLWWPLPPMLGANPSPQLPLPPPPVGINGNFLFGEIWGGFPSVATATGCHRHDTSPSPPSCACCATSGACEVWVLAGGSAVVWCSRCVLGEVFLGQPLAGHAGTALPCHPDEHPGNGEHDFFSPLIFSFFSGHGLWPSGQGQWPKLTDFALWCC